MCAAVKINRFGKFDLNPRGNLWLKDENRFGHKLLSKMGWSQGKGLGKDENGIAENLKVKMKNGYTGVGWSPKMPLAEENDEYNTVLANLNEKFKSTENKTKQEEDLKSIELRSQQFKNRIHYGKFVRGKDVCRYSEKDMNSIFVTRKSKSELSPVAVKSTVTNINSPSSEDESPETTPIYKSQMSMKEYFEMKLKAKSGKVQNDINLIKVENKEELSQRISSKKRSKDKKLKTDPESVEESSSRGEIPNHSINSTETETVEEANTKIKSSSRKRSKTTESTEKSKRLKFDPELAEELSSTNEFTTVKSDNVMVASPRKSKLSQTSFGTSKIEDELSERVNEVSEKKRRKKKDPDLAEDFSSTNEFTTVEWDNVTVTSPCKSKLSQTSFGTSKIENEESSEVSEKKKAKKRKSVKTEAVNVSEESTSGSAGKELHNDLVEFPPSEIQVSEAKRKEVSERKSKKTKTSKLEKLKTCLKHSASYSLERKSMSVSFSKQVSYRELNSDTEDCNFKTGPASESEILESTASTGNETADESLVEDEVKANATNSNDVKVELCSDGSSHCSDTLQTDKPCNVETGSDDDDDDVPECANLPKCDTSNYNCWLESQRLAAKMHIYKSMFRQIKRHPVLRTTNMLNFKGYGNWGF